MNDFHLLIQFFIDWSSTLIGPPFFGSIIDSYNLYLKYTASSISIENFIEGIIQINDKSAKSLQFNKELTKASLKNDDDIYFINIVFINKLSLLLLVELMNSRGAALKLETSIPVPRLENNLETLLKVLDDVPWDSKDMLQCTSKKFQLKQLNELLHTESWRLKLSNEKARMTTEITPFYEVCESKQHGSYCLSMIAINGGDYVINEKMRQNLLSNNNGAQRDSIQQFIHCLNTKIHFVPIVQPQTDIKLGDCSYLDTCHKISNCRYLHYHQLTPKIGIDKLIQEHNDSISKNMKISDFTWGDPVGDLTRKELPPQWANCDIRKLDFDILGKFAAVIADPPWNIHMNLPYGTCNDSELLSLPMEKLQDEGIILLWVTGRSIEIGRESLVKWGYRIVDELIWIKTNQLTRTICTGRTGHWLNHSKEHLLFGVKGDPKWAQSGVDTDVIVSTTRETSRKPDEVYGIVERMVGKKSRKLEIFGRDHNTRPGWMTIGNQLSGDHIIEQDIKCKYEGSSRV